MIALAVLAGCVPRARYDALQAAYDDVAVARDRAGAELDAVRAAEAEREARRAADAALLAAREAEREAPERALRDALAAAGAPSGTWEAPPWFAPAAATPTPALAEVAAALGPALARLEGPLLIVVASPAEGPRDLAAARAAAVVRALVAAGLPSERLVAGAAVGPESVAVRALR